MSRFVVTWRERAGEPLWRVRFRGLERAMKRTAKLLRSGTVALWDGGYVGVEGQGFAFYCDTIGARTVEF